MNFEGRKLEHLPLPPHSKPADDDIASGVLLLMNEFKAISIILLYVLLSTDPPAHVLQRETHQSIIILPAMHLANYGCDEQRVN